VSVSRKNFLNYLSTVDYIKFNTLVDDWTKIVDECEATKLAHPDYTWSLVYEDGELDVWGEEGKNLNESLKKNKEWGYLPSNTISWKTTCKSPQLHMSWENRIAKQLPFYQNCVITPTLLTPGNVMPWHRDGFHYFKLQQSPTDIEYIVRSLIFLKDWENGHYLQVEDSVIHHWKAGEVLFWHPSRYHVVANAGCTDRWTCNITGVLQEQINFKIPI
jgi:hypothetical protein